MTVEAVPGVTYFRRPGTTIWDAPGWPSLGVPVRSSDYTNPAYEAGPSNTGWRTDPSAKPVYVRQNGQTSMEDPSYDEGGVWQINSSFFKIEDVDVRGGIKINAPSCTVENARVRGPIKPVLTAGQWNGAIDVTNDAAAGFHILDTEVTNQQATELHAGIYGDAQGTIERVNIHHYGVDGLAIWGAAHDVLGVWVHDGQWFNPTTFTPPEGPHVDGAQLRPPLSGLYTGKQLFRASNIDAHTTPAHPTSGNVNLGPSCIMITPEILEVEIDNCRLDWGWFPINAGKTPNPSAVLKITNNKIRPGWFTSSTGTTYHIVATAAWQAMWTLTGNTDWDTGGPIRVRNG